MQNIWKCHGNIQHLQKNGGIGAYLFQSFVLLFVNVASICLEKKCTLALRWHCGSSLGAVDRLWLLHAHGAGASHWQYGFCVFLLFGAVAKLWETSHKQFGFALLCSSSNEGGKPLTGTLFLHLLMEITAWKKSQDSQCVFHIQPSHLRIRTFKIFILKPFSCFAEP